MSVLNFYTTMLHMSVPLEKLVNLGARSDANVHCAFGDCRERKFRSAPAVKCFLEVCVSEMLAGARGGAFLSRVASARAHGQQLVLGAVSVLRPSAKGALSHGCK